MLLRRRNLLIGVIRGSPIEGDFSLRAAVRIRSWNSF
jgi:hypothetical protein